MTSFNSLDAARAARAECKSAARAALSAWQDSVFDTLGLLGSHAGVALAEDAIVVFSGTCAEEPEPDAVVVNSRDRLLSVTFASQGRKVVLSPEEGPRWLWAESVAVWDELRDVLAQVNAQSVPTGLVVDVSNRVVYCYEPWFCPDLGAEFDTLFELDAAEANAADPFAGLLADYAHDLHALEVRVADLLAWHDVPAPSQPGHAPGECGIAGVADFTDRTDD